MPGKISYEAVIGDQTIEATSWDEIEAVVRSVFVTEYSLRRGFDGGNIKIRRVEDVTEDSRIHFLPLDLTDDSDKETEAT